MLAQGRGLHGIDPRLAHGQGGLFFETRIRYQTNYAISDQEVMGASPH